MEIYNKLFKILKQDDLLLTPNQRLIRFLHKAYAAYQQAQHKQVWPSLRIFKLETWLTLQWETQLIQATGFPYRLLTTHQERMLWQSIINQSDTHFLNPDHIAKTAQQAWQINMLWQLDGNITPLQASHETTAFKTWSERFVALSTEYACIDLARASTLLMACFKNKNLTPPSRIFLIGFDEINPQTKKLLQQLEQLGSQVSYFVASSSKTWVRRLAVENTATELQTMARWAYQQWQAGKKTIICAVPQLLAIRTQVLESFTEIFTQLNPACAERLPFNIAAGRKLSEFTLIQSALAIIQTQASQPLSKISKLIQSPYIGYADDEKSPRAQLSIYLRRHAENTLALKQLALLSQQQHCTQLNQLISQLIPLIDTQPIQQLPSQWTKHFVKKLQAFCWPGQCQLLSEDDQLIERWSELLNELSSLDFILGEINQEAALQQLTQLANELLFQAKTAYDTPIHVLGLLDTAGLCVDSLWIMGLDEQAWPASAHPNPFIPYAVQRDNATPHACNEREFYFSSLVTQRLLNSADSIMLSHSIQQDEQALRPSALIRHMPSIEASDLELPDYQNSVQSIWNTRDWEYYLDETAPTLLADELSTVSNQLFKSQAACPFQAFAKFRLKTQFYDLPSLGLSKSDRGSLLHRVIELFWNNLSDQASLLKQPAHSLQVFMNQAIDTAIAEFSKKRPLTFSPHFIAIERERLQQRLMKLIELDKNRLPFTQVIHEQKQHVTFANLVLSLRIDRIDTLSDGSQLIIDYKTGESKPSLGWSEERLDEPQLPLYCLSLPNVSGCAVIRISSHSIESQGYSEKETGLCHVIGTAKDKNIPSTWPELLNFWKTRLENLALQFQNGVATVDPKKETTCEHCHLQLLCRINHYEKSN
ncbi:uncharacterized protein RVIR1_06620 [Candidatus Rickettsiella viridis]|uniref:PD-(D/E)XK endonuclease-like domain-containing protein n=2 Tax=Candidatus Rickettsiella viridis TaxID=676208 RepID=A0A2Z5UW82_9COXI|nr:uncharacterized protein RVIR1_06620 [Candidatus Rickettsiella viridis]